MIITILSEPRSGSTNLTNWFYFNKNFTTLFLPSDPNSKWYRNTSPPNYKYETKYLLIKEDYYQYKEYDELIRISDRIILLHRENEKQQIESWINARQTNNWHGQYVYNHTINLNDEIFFKELKKSFKENYLNKDYFKISYEELYYNNGFQKIITYLNLDDVKNENFPYGKKYRIDVDKPKTLI